MTSVLMRVLGVVGMKETVVGRVLARAAECPDEPVIWTKNDGQFWGRSWGELAADVRRVAAGFARQLNWGDRVATLGENRYEWLVCDLAMQMAGIIHVPLHSSLMPAQIAYQIRHSGARWLLLSNNEQAEKWLAIAEAFPAPFRCFSWSPCPDPAGRSRLPLWATLLHELSNREIEQVEQVAEDRLKATVPVTILYTSGTEDEPKGVVLNHENIVFNVLAAIEAMGADSSHLRLCMLPFSHIYARSCDLYVSLLGGSQLALAAGRDTALADCQEIRPTVFNAVPLFYERVQRALIAAGRADEPGALQALLGGRIRLLCCGGAALPDGVFDFYQQRGLPILQGYGLTECSPVITVSTPRRYRRGSVGPVIPGIEVQLGDDGEIITRGPHVMQEYYQDPEATARAIRDGWLHTGDIGWFDSDGFLYLTGRKKEILATSGGKKISPAMIERLLTSVPQIMQAVVFGDGRDYLTALLVPHPEAVQQAWQEKWQASRQTEAASQLTSNSQFIPRPLPDFADWSADPAILAWFARYIETSLEAVSPHERVRRFAFLPRPLSIEQGELTPKFTPRRAVIAERYATVLAALYE